MAGVRNSANFSGGKGRGTPTESHKSSKFSRKSCRTMSPEEAEAAGITAKDYESQVDESSESEMSSDDDEDIEFMEEKELEEVKTAV